MAVTLVFFFTNKKLSPPEYDKAMPKKQNCMKFYFVDLH